jgi:hypothetical protein
VRASGQPSTLSGLPRVLALPSRARCTTASAEDLVRDRSASLNIHGPANDVTFGFAFHYHAKLLQRYAVMAQPTQNMVAAFLDLSIVMGDGVDVALRVTRRALATVMGSKVNFFAYIGG